MIEINVPTRRARLRGFTLVELLVVVAIIGMLAALGGVRFDKVAGKLEVAPARLPLRLPLVQAAAAPSPMVQQPTAQ